MEAGDQEIEYSGFGLMGFLLGFSHFSHGRGREESTWGRNAKTETVGPCIQNVAYLKYLILKTKSNIYYLNLYCRMCNVKNINE